MHIAIDLTSETGAPGGIRTYWCSLLQRLTAWHPDDQFTLVGAADLQVPESILSRRNVSFLSLGESSTHPFKRRLWQQLLLPSVLSKVRYDLLHSVNNILPLTIERPQVLTLLDCAAWHTPQRFSWVKRHFLTALIPPSVRRARRVLTISETTRRDVLEFVPGVDPDKLVVAPLGVEARFREPPSVQQRQAVREKYQLPRRYTLFVGALEPGKNIAGMVTAQRRLRQQGESVPPLILAGSAGWGGVRETLEGVRDVPVRWIGRVSDEELVPLYAEAEIFLFPSLWEGFGLPLLEAFATETPVITSNRSALPEVAADAAWCVDPEDPWQIADAWRQLWSDGNLQQALVERGRLRLQKYSWERLAETTYTQYSMATESTRVLQRQ